VFIIFDPPKQAIVRLTCLTILLIILNNFLFGQLQPVYRFQQDDTSLKRKYFKEAMTKKNKLVSHLGKENSKEYKEAYDGIFDIVEGLLLSSRTITDPEADSYIKSVTSRILSVNPELKHLDVRVVFTRDYPPNAYSIGDGTIAFNAGLFVYLDNEAEFAFALCHELAHYYLEHSKKRLDKLVRLKTSDSLEKELKKLSKQEYGVGAQLERMIRQLQFDIFRHSREGEEEADRIGLQFFKNTGYSGTAPITAMQLLDKIDDTSYFSPLQLAKVLSFPDYPFKDRWVKKESMIFGAMNLDEASGLSKKERDSLKTHPDCSRRLELLKASAATINGQHFQINESLFRKFKTSFIPEIVEEVYRSGNVSFNLYLALRMLQDGQHKPLAIYSIARALNEIYQHQKDHKLGLIIETENRYYKEEYNLLLRMLYRLRLYEIAELNYHFCKQHENEMTGYEGFADEMKKAKTNKRAHQ